MDRGPGGLDRKRVNGQCWGEKTTRSELDLIRSACPRVEAGLGTLRCESPACAVSVCARMAGCVTGSKDRQTNTRYVVSMKLGRIRPSREASKHRPLGKLNQTGCGCRRGGGWRSSLGRRWGCGPGTRRRQGRQWLRHVRLHLNQSSVRCCFEGGLPQRRQDGTFGDSAPSSASEPCGKAAARHNGHAVIVGRSHEHRPQTAKHCQRCNEEERGAQAEQPVPHAHGNTQR